MSEKPGWLRQGCIRSFLNVQYASREAEPPEGAASEPPSFKAARCTTRHHRQSSRQTYPTWYAQSRAGLHEIAS